MTFFKQETFFVVDIILFMCYIIHVASFHYLTVKLYQLEKIKSEGGIV